MLGSVNTSRQWNTIHFHDFLAAVPRLRSLRLDSDVIGSWNNPEPIAIPSLISLDMYTNPIFSPCIITALMTPNLESLTLRGVNESVTIGLASVLKSQHRYPFLQSVHFYWLSIPDSYNRFATVLTMLPTVTHLSLVPGEVQEALEILARNSSSALILLPELSNLQFEPIDDGGDSIYNFISHRLTNGLRRQLSSFDAISQERHAWLRERLELEELSSPNRWIYSSDLLF